MGKEQKAKDERGRVIEQNANKEKRVNATESEK